MGEWREVRRPPRRAIDASVDDGDNDGGDAASVGRGVREGAGSWRSSSTKQVTGNGRARGDETLRLGVRSTRRTEHYTRTAQYRAKSSPDPAQQGQQPLGSSVRMTERPRTLSRKRTQIGPDAGTLSEEVGCLGGVGSIAQPGPAQPSPGPAPVALQGLRSTCGGGGGGAVARHGCLSGGSLQCRWEAQRTGGRAPCAAAAGEALQVSGGRVVLGRCPRTPNGRATRRQRRLARAPRGALQASTGPPPLAEQRPNEKEKKNPVKKQSFQ